MASSGSTCIPWNKVTETVPQGVQVPMCFCGSLCKLMKSRVLGDDFGKRFFMCENYEYDPPKHYGKDRAKVLQNTIRVSLSDLVMTSNMIWGKTPPPLCDFVQWLDTEQSQQDKDHAERQARWAAQRWQRMLHEEQMKEKRKKKPRRDSEEDCRSGTSEGR